MKKLVSILLTLTLLFSLSAAAMAEETGDNIVIQFWHTRGSGTSYEGLKESVDNFNATIGKEKGITVQETFIGDYTAIMTKTQLSVQSGEQPQIVVASNTNTAPLVEDGILVDMMPYAEKSGFDVSNLMDCFMQIYGNTDGQLHSLPYIRSTPLFYYNKTMADAKGLTISSNPTIDEMVEFCKGLYEVDENGEVLVYGLEIVSDFGYFQAANLQQLGSALLADDGMSAPSLEDGTMLKVLTDWRSWVDEGWCRSFDATNAGDTMQQLFFQNKLGGFFNSSAGMRSITENCAEAGIELGVTYYPTYDAEKPVAEIGGGQIGIVGQGNSEEQIAAAWEFVQYLMSDEQITLTSKTTGYLPTTKSVANYEGMIEFWNENPLFKVAYDQLLENGVCQEKPYVPYLQDYTQYCADAVSLLIQEKSITPEEAVQQIVDTSSILF
ncbi:MAG TPA: extracellular solute-binding protein [Candidatus Faecaligallichristensenella faecipullorum]|nr:extracellular solute-binding protein [Candidatus Faecaligallichristensenella faecipullorum]